MEMSFKADPVIQYKSIMADFNLFKYNLSWT
jgi:hypothetical protein